MLSDDELLARISRREAAAFETLFARHRERVLRHLVAMLRDAEVAGDLLQEVFLRVWQRAEQWDGRGACLAWLMRIATNLALNQLRTIRRRREIPLEAPTVPGDEADDSFSSRLLDAAAIDPALCCEQTERSTMLQHLVNTLPDDKRAVIRLVFEAEMDISEVAHTLGIPEGTVKSRLHYARKHLAREWHALEEER